MTDEEKVAEEQRRYDELTPEQKQFWHDIQVWLGQHVIALMNEVKSNYDPNDPAKFFTMIAGKQLPMPDGSMWEVTCQPVIPVTEEEAAKPN